MEYWRVVGGSKDISLSFLSVLRESYGRYPSLQVAWHLGSGSFFSFLLPSPGVGVALGADANFWFASPLPFALLATVTTSRLVPVSNSLQ